MTKCYNDDALLLALQALQEELDAWQANDLSATFWWRDDDANQPDALLDQLLLASDTWQIPLALATIPNNLNEHLVQRVSKQPTVTVLQHGFAHKNHSPQGQKKKELGADRAIHDTCNELMIGRNTLRDCFNDQFLAVMVPPWNRIAEQVVSELPKLGFIGYSTFGIVEHTGQRGHRTATKFGQANMHVDIIDWRNTRKTFAPTQIVAQLVDHLQARRSGRADIEEATGFMTHHLVHDDEAWAFIDKLFSLCQCHPAAHWLSCHEVFDYR